MEPGRQRAEAWLADLTRAQREADRKAQEPARLGAGAEIAGQDSRRCQPEQIEAQEGSGAARACACACPTAERAMLDEIIALPDIEEQDGENVAAWVANALEALREERDVAMARADRAEALLRECDRELTATAGAVSDLLCDPAWVVLHNHGWASLKEHRPTISALLGRIREVLGARS